MQTKTHTKKNPKRKDRTLPENYKWKGQGRSPAVFRGSRTTDIEDAYSNDRTGARWLSA